MGLDGDFLYLPEDLDAGVGALDVVGGGEPVVGFVVLPLDGLEEGEEGGEGLEVDIPPVGGCEEVVLGLDVVSHLVVGAFPVHLDDFRSYLVHSNDLEYCFTEPMNMFLDRFP